MNVKPQVTVRTEREFYQTINNRQALPGNATLILDIPETWNTLNLTAWHGDVEVLDIGQHTLNAMNCTKVTARNTVTLVCSGSTFGVGMDDATLIAVDFAYVQAFGRCHVTLKDSAGASAFERTRTVASGHSSVHCHQNATAILRDDAAAFGNGNAVVSLRGNASASLDGFSVAQIFDGAHSVDVMAVTARVHLMYEVDAQAQHINTPADAPEIVTAWPYRPVFRPVVV